MALFGKKYSNLHTVVDVGSSTLRALIFEASEARMVNRVIKKFVEPMPLGRGQTVKKLREFIFAVVRSLEKVPLKITVTLGPHFGDHMLTSWTLRPSQGFKSLSRKELQVQFQNLFQQNRDGAKSVIAYPVGVIANGYSINRLLAERDRTAQTLLTTRDLAGVKELGFRALLLYFPNEPAFELMEVKQSLGGLPIEFVPLGGAQKEAVLGAFQTRDAFLIDIGGEETALMLLRDGELTQCASFSIGMNHTLRGISKAFSASFNEAKNLRRQYAQGILNSALRSRMRDFLALQVEAWKKKLVETLGAFYTSGPIPPAIFLFGEGTDTPEFGTILRKGEWLQGASYTEAPEVRILAGESFFGGDTLGGNLKGAEDVNLASGVFYSLHHEPLF